MIVPAELALVEQMKIARTRSSRRRDFVLYAVDQYRETFNRQPRQ
jgi:hypothetical protein